MANTNLAFGLQPISKFGSNVNNTGISGYTLYEIKNDNSNRIYQGSPVIPLSTGFIDIVGAAAGGSVGLLGVFGGCEFVSSTTGKPVFSNQWTGSGADSNFPIKAYVYDDPMQLYKIAADASVTSEATLRGNVFANANFAAGASGSNTTGISSAKLGVSTIATTAALHLRIMGWQDDENNSDFAAAGIPVIVRLNNHFNSPNGGITAGTPSTTGVQESVMPISRAQLAKELEPGLNALFGMEFARYENEHAEIFDTETSDRAFEEEVMLSGFGTAPTKFEGSAVNFDTANESFTARYTHETIALAFSITEEAIEDNLYDRLGARYTRALARSMAHTKQVKAASILNNAFTAGAFAGGDGVALCDASHPLTSGGTFNNEPSVAADLNETSLEDALITISGFVDERGLKIALRGMKLIIPPALQFVAERLTQSTLRVATADNDINALRNMGMIPQGYVINHFLTDTDAFFIKTDAPNGFKHFERAPIKTQMEGDFDTGNMRFKARERYSFGFSDPRCVFGSPGA